MSSRTYFERRTAIPGFTFLLFVIITNWVPLIEILKTGDPSEIALGAILAVLTLLGGSAIGFLVSQIWWVFYQRGGEQYSGELSEGIYRVRDKYHLVRPGRKNCWGTYSKEDMDKIQNVMAVWGYVIHYEMSQEGMKEVVAYTTRRWDVYNLHSSTMVALLLGLGGGLILRFLSQVCLFHETKASIDQSLWRLLEAFVWIYKDPIDFVASVPEFSTLLLTILIVVVLLHFLKKGRKYVAQQYNKVSRAIVEGCELKVTDLRRIFHPNDAYFRDVST